MALSSATLHLAHHTLATVLYSVFLNLYVFSALKEADYSMWKIVLYALFRHVYIYFRVQLQCHLLRGTHCYKHHTLLNPNKIHCSSPWEQAMFKTTAISPFVLRLYAFYKKPLDAPVNLRKF